MPESLNSQVRDKNPDCSGFRLERVLTFLRRRWPLKRQYLIFNFFYIVKLLIIRALETLMALRPRSHDTGTKLHRYQNITVRTCSHDYGFTLRFHAFSYRYRVNARPNRDNFVTVSFRTGIVWTGSKSWWKNTFSAMFCRFFYDQNYSFKIYTATILASVSR